MKWVGCQKSLSEASISFRLLITGFRLRPPSRDRSGNLFGNALYTLMYVCTYVCIRGSRTVARRRKQRKITVLTTRRVYPRGINHRRPRLNDGARCGRRSGDGGETVKWLLFNDSDKICTQLVRRAYVRYSLAREQLLPLPLPFTTTARSAST